MNTKSTTLERLENKTKSYFRSGVKMPSINSIAKLLKECSIDFELSNSTNIVEYRTKGRCYVNSRHNGKEGKRLIIRLDEKDSNILGWHYLEMDTSDSYYSWNTSGYARSLVALIILKTIK